MNTIFSIKRFFQLIKLHTTLHKKSILLQFGAFAGLAFIVTGFIFKNATAENIAFDWIAFFYMPIILFAGSYYTSRSFSYMHNTRNANDILLPVSKFERFLLPTIFSGVLFIAFFTLYFWFLGRITTSFWSLIYGITELQRPVFSDSSKFFIVVSIFLYIIAHPVFLIGSISFKKNRFFFTGLLLFVAVILLVFYGYVVSTSIYESEKFAITNLDNDVVTNIKPWIKAIFLNIALTTVAFFKLKEKEV